MSQTARLHKQTNSNSCFLKEKENGNNKT